MSASAFPTMTLRLREQGYPEDVMQGEIGLTKRELFAAMAMQGFVSADDYQHVMLGREYGVDDFASASVRIADALIAALEKTND